MISGADLNALHYSVIGILKVMTDLPVGATAGLSSSASIENTAGQASSGTPTVIPLCHMPTKRAELLRTDIRQPGDC